MVSLITATKSRWKRMRNIINPTFSQVKLRELSPAMIKCIDENLACFKDEINDNVNVTR
jgi:cytochrome P450